MIFAHAFRCRALILLITACVLSVFALAPYVTAAQPEALPVLLDLPRPSTLAPESAACSLKNHYPTALTYFSGIQPEDKFASFMNPANCTGPDDYPFALYFVSLPLFHFAGAHWPVGVELQIWSVTDGDSCSGPDQKIFARHFLLDSASFAAPKVGVISLSDPVCVSEPFYVVIEYDGTTPAPFPSVLFDTMCPPVPCANWGFRDGWAEWSEFWEGAIAGNMMVWVDGYSNSNFCATTEDTIRSIPGLHDDYESLQGQRVAVVGYYTNDQDKMMVTSYTDYLANTPLPAKSELHIFDPQPPDIFNGAFARVTGYLLAEPVSDPGYPDDSVRLYLLPTGWEKIFDGPPTPAYPSPPEGESIIEESYLPEVACDSCKFAILMSGGINADNNHARYWNELQMMYKYKTEQAGYCPNNVLVRYYDGVSRNTAQIPQANVDSCTPSRIKAAHQEIARRIAACTRAGKTSTLQKFVSNHGSPDGINMFGWDVLRADSFRVWQQMCIDSCVKFLYDEMTQCYSGNVVESLKNLNDKMKTTINANAAGGNVVTWSTPDWCPYIKIKLDSLYAGSTYGGAVAGAATGYGDYVDSLAKVWEEWLASTRQWLLDHPPGTVDDTIRTRVVQDTLKTRGQVDGMKTGRSTDAGRPAVWVRHQMKRFCEWKQIVVPKGGHVCLEFKGETNKCGNVTVYSDTVGGGLDRNKVAVWNWNIPGSAGYATGHNRRYLNGDTAKATPLWVHNDNGEFTFTASIYTTPTDSVSPSNVQAFAGFSVGGVDTSSAEFAITAPPVVILEGVELPGFRLQAVPQIWGPCGTHQIFAHHSVMEITPWHESMQFRIDVAEVITPGILEFHITGVEHPMGTFNITTPGTYTHDCGAMFAVGPNQIEILGGTTCFALDAFALRSMALEPASCCEGTTGNVNATGIIDGGDLALLVAYLTNLPSQKPTLPCVPEANVNGTGIVDGGDLALLVAYITNPPDAKPALPLCP